MAFHVNKDAFKVAGENKTPATSISINKSINGIPVKGDDIDYRDNLKSNILLNTLAGAAPFSNTYDDKKYELYKKYNTYLNPGNTQEELDKERANNQSGVEQIGRSLAQIVENEVGIGTLLGFSDLFDVVANGIGEVVELLGGPEHVNDFQNAFSKVLTEAQDRNKERLAIYREDPNKTFALGDLGWWTDNFVSVGTTLSLMIPSVGITKGVSALGKLAKTARAESKLNKLGKVGKEIKNTTRLGEKLRGIGQVTSSAVMSRTMEDWQEGREVYNSTLQDTKDKLSKLNSQERIKLLENNPEFINEDGTPKSDEEISKLIASNAGMYTFWKDYWMLLMDIPQYFALGSLWKGIPNKASSARLSITSKNATKAFAEDTGALVSELNATEAGKAVLKGTKEGYIKNNLWNRIKEDIKNPLSLFNTFEIGEGIEEGFQGIQSEKGKEVANIIFDPSTPNRTLASYLRDPNIWEQAFWGAIGGIAFKGFGTGIGELGRKIEYNSTKKKLGDKFVEQNYAKWNLTEEKMREYEILNRKNIWDKLVNDISLIDEGKNPFEAQVKNENGENVYQTITESQKIPLKSHALNQFLTEFTINAAEVGNIDSLIELVKSKEFKDTIKNSSIANSFDSNFESLLTDKIEKTRDLYYKYLKESLPYSDKTNGQIANIIARDSVTNALIVEDLQERLNKVNSELNESSTENITDDVLKYYKKEYFKAKYNELIKIRANAIDDFNNGSISKVAYNQILTDTNEELESLNNWFNELSSSEDIFEDIKPEELIGKEQFSKILELLSQYEKDNESSFNNAKNTVNNLTKNQQELLKTKVALNENIYHINDIIPKTNKDYSKLYNEYSRFVEKKAVDRMQDALNRIKTHLRNSENPRQTLTDILKQDTEVYDGFNKDMELLRLGYKDGQLLLLDIHAEVNKILGDREEEKRKSETPNISGEEKTDERSKRQTEKLVPEEGQEQDADELNTKDNPKPKSNKRKPKDESLPLRGSENEQLKKDTEEKIPEDTGLNYDPMYGEKPSFKDFIGEDEGAFEFEGPIDKFKDIETLHDEAPSDIPDKFKNNPLVTIDEINNHKIYNAALKILNDSFNNTIDNNIKKLVGAAIESGNPNSKEYKKLFNTLYNIISNDDRFDNIDNFTEGINSAIIAKIQELSLMMDSLNRDNTKAEELLNKLLNSPITLKSRLASADPKVSDENSQLIYDILKQYIKSLGTEVYSGVTYKVNVVQLFNEFANKNNATFEDLLQLYRILVPYINTGFSNIKFINIGTFVQGFDLFLATSIRKYTNQSINNYGLAIAGLNEDESLNTNDEAKRKLEDIVKGKIINPDITLEISESFPNTMTVVYTEYNGDKITKYNLGYINRVHIGKYGNILIKRNSKGFSFKFNKIDKTNIISNFDDLFKYLNNLAIDIQNGNRNHESILLDIIENYNKDYILTNEEIKIILETPEIKKLIQIGNTPDSLLPGDEGKYIDFEGGIKFKNYISAYKDKQKRIPAKYKISISRKKQAEIIIENIRAILSDADGTIRTDDIYNKFTKYKSVLYTNLQNTLNAEKALKEGRKLQLKVNNIGGRKLNTSDTKVGIKTLFNKPEDKLLNCVYIYDSVNNITDMNTSIDFGDFITKPNTVGIITPDKRLGNNIVITGNNTTLVESQSTLINDVKSELTNIINDFLDDKKRNDNTFENLYQTLVNLLDNKNGIRIFEGIQVIRVKDYIIVRQKYGDTNNKIITFSKYKNKTAASSARVNPKDMYMSFWSADNNYKKAIKLLKKNSEKQKFIANLVEKYVDTIINNLQFKQSNYLFNNLDVENDTNNQYYGKENGKFVVNINNNKRIYNNWADFIISENTMKTNVRRNEDGSFTTIENIDKIAFEIDEIALQEQRIINVNNTNTETFNEVLTRGKLNIDITNPNISPEFREQFKNINTNSQISTVELLKASGLSDAIINILTSPIGKSNHKLIPDTIIYDNTQDEYGDIDVNTGQIYLGNKFEHFSNYAQRRKELIRTLIHENFHKAFNDNSINTSDYEKLLNDFIAVYDLFVQDVTANKDNNEDANKIYDWLQNTGFSPDSYEDIKEFVEEWITESFTNNLITKYLNQIEYKDAKASEIKGTKKTLLQKIIDAIINFFKQIDIIKGKYTKDEANDIYNIKDDTLLAKEYVMLSNVVSNKKETAKDKKQKKTDASKKTTRTIKQKSKNTEEVFVQGELFEDTETTNETLPVKKDNAEVESKDIKEPIIDDKRRELLDRVKELKNKNLESEDTSEEDEHIFSRFPSVDSENLTQQQIADEYRRINPSINPNGISNADNVVEDYLNNFSEQDRFRIAKLVANGDLKWLC